MIPELGNLALIAALFLSLLHSGLPLLWAIQKKLELVRLSVAVTLLHTMLVTLAFGALLYAHITSDFTVVNVVKNSHTAKPLLYKISGAWGNHEGSMLLWTWLLCLYTLAYTLIKIRKMAFFVPFTQHIISAGFLSFILFTSNPFVRIFPPPQEGEGLNPLLQDVGLAFHPPFLYLGYVGFSIPFSLAVSGLLAGNITRDWADSLRKWALFPWSFLTFGIGLGSWWAYRELGWGGFWFWDPVENASLMPWLCATALVHSAAVTAKRQLFSAWTLFLALTSFCLSLLGTFLVRSGVLTSVHSFANDPARGAFILLFLSVITLGALTLFAVRGTRLRSVGRFAPLSRESFILLNNLLMVVGCFTIMLGTLYPLFYELFSGHKLSVGQPYFTATFIPLMLPVLILAGLGIWLSWKRASLADHHITFLLCGLIVVAGVGAVVLYYSAYSPLFIVSLAASLWMICATLAQLAARIQLIRSDISGALMRLTQLPKGYIGMILAHLGFGLLALGVTIVSTFSQDKDQLLRPQQSMIMGEYKATLLATHYQQKDNYLARSAQVRLEKNTTELATLLPELRFYPIEKNQTTEASIYSTLFADVYAAIGEQDDKGIMAVRLYFRPFISWIWAGVVLMMAGGLFSWYQQRKLIEEENA